MAVLPDARFAYEHGIVFGPARQDLNDAADFVVAADHRVQLAAARKVGQIARISLQGLVFLLGIRIRHALASPNGGKGLENAILACSHPAQDFAGQTVRCGDSQQEMLGRDVFVLELVGLFLGLLQNTASSLRGKRELSAVDFRL